VPLDCNRWEERGAEYRYQGKKPELDSNGARKIRYRSGRLDIVLKGEEYSPNAISGPVDWVETTFAVDGVEYCGRWEDIQKNEPDKIKAKGPTVPCQVTGQCADGIRNGDESDVDCGGSCQPCSLGGRCNQTSDCTVTSGHYCSGGSCLGHGYGAVCDPSTAPTPGGTGWMDSYAIDGRCWCDTTFDHDLGGIIVNTPVGPRTVFDICTQLDAFAPLRQSGDPIFNDAQCGNGPANTSWDEDPSQCPGRVDQGSGGCCTIGPTWDLSLVE
jgi:hypothetical protein